MQRFRLSEKVNAFGVKEFVQQKMDVDVVGAEELDLEEWRAHGLQVGTMALGLEHGPIGGALDDLFMCRSTEKKISPGTSTQNFSIFSFFHSQSLSNTNFFSKILDRN